LNRLRKEFLDPNSQKNMSRLNADLSDIQLIMKNNINEVLQRGEKLESALFFWPFCLWIEI
jgi:vesicle transport protein SEC22